MRLSRAAGEQDKRPLIAVNRFQGCYRLLWVSFAVAIALAGCGSSQQSAETKPPAPHKDFCEQFKGGDYGACVAGEGYTESPEGEAVPSAACDGFSGSGYSACMAGFEYAEGTYEPSGSSSAGQTRKEVGGPLADVGTIRVSDEEGTTFTDHYKLAPLIYPDEGMPPQTVLEACNIHASSVLAKSVFARGEVSVNYTEGSFPEQTSLGTSVQGAEPLESVVAYALGDKWLCRQEELASTTYEIRPGQTKVLPIWFLAENVLSNAQPRVPAEVSDSWYFSFIGPSLLPQRGTTTISGSGAGSCYGTKYLYLYNRSGHCERG